MNHESNSRGSSHLRTQHGSQPYPSEKPSVTVAYSVLVSILVYYVLQYFNSSGLPVLEVLWNIVVWLTPSQIVARLDSGFETAMAGEKKGTREKFDSREHASKSNAMRRILGLDGTGIMTTVQRTRTMSNLGSVFKAQPQAGLPGLGNWDNACYQNSVLQSLAAMQSLPAFLEQNLELDEIQPTKSALRGVIDRLNDPANRGKTFWTPAELKNMSSWQQQDAQEYFSKLSDEIEKDTSKVVKCRTHHNGLQDLSVGTTDASASSLSGTLPTTKSFSNRVGSGEAPRISQLPEELVSLLIRNPLEGLLAQRVGCQKCGFVEGLSLVPFNCLTVPLGRGRNYDIRTCLDDYTALEPINGVECANCTLLRAKQSLEKVLSSIGERSQANAQESTSTKPDVQLTPLQQRLHIVDEALEGKDLSDQALKKCQIPPKSRVLTTKSRQAVIARAPKSLVIHVNRSTFDELTGMQSKNLANVSFPSRLNLAPWCLGQTVRSCDEGSSTESWNADPSKSMLSDSNSEEIDLTKGYELRAVITHYGRHENGHYICYRKSPYSTKIESDAIDEHKETWWRLSDEDVMETDEELVLSQGGVFMLFYERTIPPLDLPHEAPKPQQDVADGADCAASNLEIDPLSKSHTEEPASSDALPGLLTPPATPNQFPAANEPDGTTGNFVPTPRVKNCENLNPSLSDPIDLPPVTSQPIASKLSPSPVSTLPGSITESAKQQTRSVPPRDVPPISPASMRTATPRGSRASMGRAGNAMEPSAGIVQAN